MNITSIKLDWSRGKTSAAAAEAMTAWMQACWPDEIGERWLVFE